MGDKNTISLLTSINGYLKTIVESTKQNKGPKEVQETMTKNLNQGSVVSGAATKAPKGQFGDVILSGATIAALNSLPVVVKNFSKLEKKDIKNFTSALIGIQVAINKFSEGTKEIKGAENIVRIIKALSILEKVGLTRLAVSLKIANALGIGKSLNTFVQQIARAAKSAGKINSSDLEKVKKMSETMTAFSSLTKGVAVIMGTVIATAVAIKFIGEKEVIKSVGITLGVLTALVGLSIAVGALAKSVKGATTNLKDVSKFLLMMQGVVLGTLLIGVIAQKAWPQIAVGFGVISGIILGYTVIATLAGALFKLVEMNKAAMAGVFIMAAWGMALTLGTLLVGYVAQEAWPDIVIGFGAITGVILGYAAVAAAVSVIAKLSPTFKQDVLMVTMMAGISMGLVLGTLLMGYVAQEAWPDIIKGFATTALVVEGFAGLALLVSMTAKGITTYKQDFITLGLFAAGCEALLLGTVAIAWVTKKAGVTVGEIVLTIAGIGAIVMGLLRVADIIEKAKFKNLSKNIVFLKELALFGGECELLLAGVIGLAILAKKADPKYVLGVTVLLGGIVHGLVNIIEYLDKHNKSLKTGAKNLLFVEAVALGAEAVLGGVLALAAMAKASDPKYVLGTVVMLGLTIYGFTMITEFMKDHNRSLMNGAKNLLLVEAIALGAEAVLGGVILLAKHLDDPNLIWQIPVTIGLLSGIIYGITELVKLIDTNKKEIISGAKSMLLVEAVALGAEAVLAGVIGIAWLANKANVGAAEIVGITMLIGGIVTGLVHVLQYIEKHNKNLEKGARSMLLVEAVALGAEAILAGVIGLAWLSHKANVTPDEIIGITMLIGGIVTGLVYSLNIIEKNQKNLEKGAKSLLQVVKCALLSGLILAEVIGIEKLRQVAGVSWVDIGVTIAAMATIVAGFGALAYVAGKFDKEIKKGLKSLLKIEAFAAGAGLLLAGVIGLVALKNAVGASFEEINATIDAMGIMIAGFGALALLVGMFDKQIKKALPGIGIITLFAFAAGALLTGVLGIIALKNTIGAEWSDVFTTIGAMATLVAGFGVLAVAVGLATAYVTAGLAGIGVITLFALAAGALLASTILLVDLKNKLKVEWSDVFTSIGAMATIVAAFGLLGAAVGLASAPIVAGLAGIGVVTLLAVAAGALLYGIIELVSIKEKLKVSWEDVFMSVGAMATIVAAFGTLGAAIGLAAPAVAIGLLGVPTVITLGLSASKILGNIVDLVDKKQKAQASWEDMIKTMGMLALVVGEFGALGAAVGTASLLIAPALLAVPSILSLGVSAAAILGGVIDLTEKKKNANTSWEEIDETMDKMEGTIVSFGTLASAASLTLPFLLAGSAGLLAAIEIAKQSAAMLGSVLVVASDAKSLGKDSWNLIDTTLSYMHKIIIGDSDSKGFKQLCESASFAYPFLLAGAAGIKEVSISAVNVGKALSVICKAAAATKESNAQEIINVIKSFEIITDKLYDIIGIGFVTKAKAISNQKKFINDISVASISIANALANMAGVAKEGGLMRAARIKPNGEFAFGPWVNATGSAITIASTMEFFVNTLYDSFNKIDKDSNTRISEGMKMLQGVMEPVSNFAMALGSFQDAGEGKIRQLKYDDKGKLIDTPAIDVTHVAKNIGSAISAFCNELFSDANQSMWERMTKGSSYGTNTSSSESGSSSEIVYKPGAAEKSMGILSTLIDPIANFAQTLGMFEAGGEGELVVPIYDEKGNLKSKRTINVANVAKCIGSAVTTFITTLTDNSKDWIKLYTDSNRAATYETRSSGFLGLSSENVKTGEAGNDMADAFGIFSTVMQPVISFTKLLETFGSSSETGKLLVFDDKGSREIDPSSIATLIANTITGFIKTLNTGLSSKEGLNSLTSNKSLIIESVDALSKALESLGNVDGENALGFYTAFSNIMTIVYSVGEEKNTTLIKAATTNISSISKVMDEMNNVMAGGNNNPTVSTLTNMVSLLTDIGNKFSSIKTISSDVLPGLSTSLQQVSDNFDLVVNHKKTGILQNNNKLKKAFDTTTFAIKNFDDTLSGKNSTRIKNIKNLKEAITELDNASKNIESRLSTINSTLQGLAVLATDTAADNLQKVAQSINTMGSHNIPNAFGGGQTTSVPQMNPEAIGAAFSKALDGVRISLIKKDEMSGKGERITGYLDSDGGSFTLSGNHADFD